MTKMTVEKSSDSWRTPDDLFQVLDKGGIYQGIEFKGFNFDMDLCARQENSKCIRYCIDYLKGTVGYTFDPLTIGKKIIFDLVDTAFMNPPYSNPKPFIEKAWEDSKYCKIVCLVKCDPSTKWWSTFWSHSIQYDYCTGCGFPKPEPFYRECVYCSHQNEIVNMHMYHGAKPGCEVLFFPKRIKFDPPRELVDAGVYYKRGIRWYTTRHVEESSYRGVKEFTQEIEVSGPTFPSALIIMDRRGIK